MEGGGREGVFPRFVKFESFLNLEGRESTRVFAG